MRCKEMIFVTTFFDSYSFVKGVKASYVLKSGHL